MDTLRDPDLLPRTVDRRDGPHGELVLRRAGEHYEIISNGTFLMDTRNGESERLLVRAALDRSAEPGARVLIGGLGVGFSLRCALDHPATGSVTVVELLRAIVEWHRGPLAAFSGHALDDPRTTVDNRDLLDWLTDSTDGYDAICLDIDNGPDWTVVPENGSLYDLDATRSLAARLNPGGVLTVWSAADSAEYAARLREVFTEVTVLPVPVPVGEPDVVFVARHPR